MAGSGLVSADNSRAFPESILGRPAAARDEPFQAGYREISADYFRTLGVPLLKGRVFTARDAAGAPGVAIINETMARQFLPGEDPIGARVQADLLRGRTVHEDLIADQSHTIVGVACLAVALIRVVVVPMEEQALVAKFGDEYRAYMNRTGGLVPSVSVRRHSSIETSHGAQRW